MSPSSARERSRKRKFFRGLAPITVPQFDGWVVGGEVRCSSWSARPVRIFSVHGPAGERGYVRTMHEILDRVLRIRGDGDLTLAGDFNVAVGRRPTCDPRPFSRGERDLLDRTDVELDLIACWQTANPGRRLAQTLRWSRDPTIPYHCDGIFVRAAGRRASHRAASYGERGGRSSAITTRWWRTCGMS